MWVLDDCPEGDQYYYFKKIGLKSIPTENNLPATTFLVRDGDEYSKRASYARTVRRQQWSGYAALQRMYV